MPTRPGYIWSGTEWVSIGQEAAVAPVSYQASAPSTPATGDIWIDSNDDVPGIDTSQFLRWRKTAAGGETSVSGTDDNGLTLQYTANYEQVYLNGVLLVRGQDYTATNGTSITGLTALAANDVVEVFGVVARVVGDVYTQAQTNSLLDAKSPVSTTGAVLIASNTFSAVSSVSFNNCFSSSYDNYLILMTNGTSNVGAGMTIQLTSGGTAASGSDYKYSGFFSFWASGGFNQSGSYSNGATSWRSAYFSTTPVGSANITIMNPNKAQQTTINQLCINFDAMEMQNGVHTLSTSYDGFKVTPSGGTISGTIKVYGYK